MDGARRLPPAPAGCDRAIPAQPDGVNEAQAQGCQSVRNPPASLGIFDGLVTLQNRAGVCVSGETDQARIVTGFRRDACGTTCGAVKILRVGGRITSGSQLQVICDQS